MKKELEGKVALVTGGGSGIGRASAFAFITAGAKVIVSDIDVKAGEGTTKMIVEKGGDAIFVKTDVTKASEVEALIKKSVEIYGCLDCAHNNAGTVEKIFANTADCTEENWDRVINTNLKGVWLCMKYEIPQMLKHGSGSIVNTSSVNGLVGNRNIPAYCASKHGIVGLTKSAALEYAQAGIRINAVCPGVINTPMSDQFIRDNPQYEAQLVAKHPIGRFGTPEEVAESVVWLSSALASFITGHSLVVDGGRIAG